MADTKISSLTALSTPSDDDLFAVVDDPTGSPVTKKVSLTNLRAALLDLRTAASSGDVTLSSDNTFVDIPSCSLALAAGTWIVVGQFQCYKSATGVTTWDCQIVNSSASTIY